jgi:hypothetical protein
LPGLQARCGASDVFAYECGGGAALERLRKNLKH